MIQLVEEQGSVKATGWKLVGKVWLHSPPGLGLVVSRKDGQM